MATTTKAVLNMPRLINSQVRDRARQSARKYFVIHPKLTVNKLWASSRMRPGSKHPAAPLPLQVLPGRIFYR